MAGLFDDSQNDVNAQPGGGLFGAAATVPGAWSGGTPAIPRPQEPAVVVQAPLGTTLDSIPAPYKPVSDGDLTPQEEQDLEACEAGVDNLRTAFWIAGKSLETMRTANLTRKRHSNFAEYVWQRWEISESHMHRLIEEWRIGEPLAKRGLKPLESQVRELVDFAREYGNAAAVAVYEGVAQAGSRVTAKLIGAVVQELPAQLPGGADTVLVTEKAKELAASEAVSKKQPKAASKGGDPGSSKDAGHGSSEAGKSSAGGKDGPAGADSPDLEALDTVVTCLNAALTQLQGSVAERALSDTPEKARPLVQEIALKVDQLAKALPAVPEG